MKLIDILARELKEWPEGADCITQDNDGQVWPCNNMSDLSHNGEMWTSMNGFMLDADILPGVEVAKDAVTAVVTRAEWEAAHRLTGGHGVIGRFEPKNSYFHHAFYVVTRNRSGEDDAWEGLKDDGVTNYHVYDEYWTWVPITPAAVTPTLETMLVELRDLNARGRAAQAEADALFEHAGQLHGEIVVRLAELGWGAPRMIPGEPVVTLDTPPLSDDWYRHVKAGDMLTYHVGDGRCHMGKYFTDGESYKVYSVDSDPECGQYPFEVIGNDGDHWWGNYNYFTPSTQP